MLPVDINGAMTKAQDTVFDQRGMNAIRALGREQSPEALREVAKKFEAMFVQEMLKSMRATNEVFAEGSLFSSEQEKFHRDMLDQQMSIELTNGRGLGLADYFYQNMLLNYGKHLGQETENRVTAALPLASSPITDGKLADVVKYQQWGEALRTLAPVVEEDEAADSENRLLNAYHTGVDRSNLGPVYANRIHPAGGKLAVSPSQESFVAMLKPHAEQAAKALDINPDVLVAQVALETGWGKHVIHTRQGENSFNLFNIKASSRWQGDSVNVATLEYKQGMPQYERANFKKYSSYAESFADYVALMKNNARYQPALAVGKNSPAYAEALQEAGYATDPQYANKIKRLLKNEAISTLSGLAQSAQSLLSLASQARERLME
ncbi:flagellar assembly peptidoglycan hydrolase FlgJ [Cellvibrio japonicus]|uniref:Peptidoglycan hydrolase FlgJ n=1 Tax=Cellvibrio japonicus (strain Ueda107) TaxID=498211 RepID=B3PGS0_CELJU|nr:flagellar assembly peptidoglycan hydrolase FlgJ [Cellvibrio japonicus]ACE85754.1 endo-beta-N-acetylglucosaminidase, putative, acm73B [Cellvibrio japonicus Ueda107]QEI12415.1 flagellar assembly peptidoglycan hydrolase FlgJ [Cellvibrio japonicus]QEI15988.1 flagellar assembly peptidoglycan hydrolase FlgJ [Cellvibrio japonicus]QEI19567.1 flagellar assembly peptidoglycan hydrolase FlgJ [Cellvibrio japonicus]